MLKDMIKARPTSLEMYSVSINTRIRPRPSCTPSGSALGSGPDTCVDTRPLTSLSVGLVYVYVYVTIIDKTWLCRRMSLMPLA